MENGAITAIFFSYLVEFLCFSSECFYSFTMGVSDQITQQSGSLLFFEKINSVKGAPDCTRGQINMCHKFSPSFTPHNTVESSWPTNRPQENIIKKFLRLPSSSRKPPNFTTIWLNIIIQLPRAVRHYNKYCSTFFKYKSARPISYIIIFTCHIQWWWRIIEV